MTLDMMLRAMFHSLSVAVFGLSLLLIGAMLLSFRLNDQTWAHKARNIAKFATAVYGVAGYYTLLAFMASSPLPVSLWLATTAALPAIVAGDVLGLLVFRYARRRTLSHTALTLEGLAKKVSGPRLIRWWFPAGVGLILIAAALACTSDLSTLTPGPSPATGDAATQATPPAQTPAPTAGVTSTPRPLPAERLSNGGFEGEVRPVIFPEVNVFTDWEPFYCDEPYSPEKCPAERRDTQSPAREGFNEPDLMMGRHEFKPANPYMDDCEGNPYPTRVHGGCNAQQFFLFSRVGRGGVFQSIQTNPGEVCEVSAWVMTWSQTSGEPWSRTATDDDRANSTWFIRVDPDGGTFVYTPGLLSSRAFTYDDGHYDTFVEIRHTFTATGNRATIFFENVRLWPFPQNDSYLDDASVSCGLPEPEPTPTAGPVTSTGTPTLTPTWSPTPTPGPTGSPTGELGATPTRVITLVPPAATPLGGERYPRWSNVDSVEYVMIRFANLRNAPDITGDDVGDRLAGETVRVECYWEVSPGGDVWASEQACSDIYPLWTALTVGGLDYMRPVEGPAGR